MMEMMEMVDCLRSCLGRSLVKEPLENRVNQRFLRSQLHVLPPEALLPETYAMENATA